MCPFHPQSEPGAPARALASDPAHSLSTSNAYRCSAGKIDVVVAAVSNDLRSSSVKTTELMRRSLASISMTAELVAWSREAIASSRGLLNRP